MKLAAESIIFILILNNLNLVAQPLNIDKWNLNNKFQDKRTIDAAVTQYYEKKTFMMSISVYLEYSKLWQHCVMDFLSDALTNSKLMKYEIFMNTTNRLQRLTKISHHNLWYVDSYKAFCSLLVAVQNNYSDRMGEYVVIMDTAKTFDQQREVQLILEKAFEMNIIDIVLAVYASNDTFILYSYEIFDPHRCRQVRVKQVNIFQNGRFQNEELFPYKLNNFHNCSITMFIRNTSLYYRFNLTQDGTQIASIEGVEAMMIQTMAKKLYFKLRMHFYKNPADTVGSVYENGTAVGPFRLLNENNLDVVLGYYHYPVRSRYFGESVSYAFMPLVIVIREYKKNDFVEVWPFKPFSLSTWLILGLFALLVIILVQLAHYYLKKRITWIDIVGLVLGNSRPLHIKSFITKLSFLLCVFGIMIICATFQGRLYYAFNSEEAFKMTQIQQLVDANYTFLLTRRFSRDLIRSLQIPLKQIHFVDAAEDYTIYETMRTYPSNAATFTNYWDFQMYIESKKCCNEFYVIPMVVILNQICAYMKRHSYLIEPFNRVIYSLRFAGILNKWMQDLTNVDKTNEIGLTTKHKLSNKPLPLTANKFRIVFAGLIFFYLLSILTFLGEIIVKNWKSFGKKLKQIMSFGRKTK